MSEKRTRRSAAELLGDKPAKKIGRPVAPHRERLVNAQAELAEIRAKRLRGELIPAAEVAREWASICADIRQRMLAIPSRCAARGIPRDAVATLDDEIRAALRALAGAESDSDVGDTQTA